MCHREPLVHRLCGIALEVVAMEIESYELFFRLIIATFFL